MDKDLENKTVEEQAEPAEAPEAEKAADEIEAKDVVELQEPRKPAARKPNLKLITAFAAMGLVIVGLAIALIVTNTGKKDDSSAEDAKSAAASDAEGNGDDEESAEDTEDEDSEEDEESEEDEDSDEEEESDEDEDSEEDSEEESKDEAKNSNEVVLTYSGNNSWQDGATIMTGMELAVYNGTGDKVSDWKLELEVEGLKNCQGWNGTYTCKGDTLTITPADYNKDSIINVRDATLIAHDLNLNFTQSHKADKGKYDTKSIAVLFQGRISI